MVDVAEPCMRSFAMSALRNATQVCFGAEGLADVLGRLAPDVRARIGGDQPLPKWTRERDAIAWCFGVWEGPARRERAKYETFIRVQVDHGFGRVRRTLLGIATPKMVIDKSPGLWEAEHTHGALEVRHESASAAVLRLRDHPYVETPQARATMAEVFRYIVSLTRCRSVSETHTLEGRNALVVRLTWT